MISDALALREGELAALPIAVTAEQDCIVRFSSLRNVEENFKLLGAGRTRDRRVNHAHKKVVMI